MRAAHQHDEVKIRCASSQLRSVHVCPLCGMLLGPSRQAAKTLRIFELEGGCNFRDLGGYRTRDGRELKWGRIFRAGVLSYFSSDDQQQLKQLGLRAICDLRYADEREREPTRWPDLQTQHLSWDDGNAPPTIGSIATANSYPYTEAGMRAASIDLYRALPEWMAPRLRGMFECIAADNIPLLVHCSAGKDRTGIAIALLLSALDVSHETIVEDYLLTNDACDLVQFMLKQNQDKTGVGGSYHPLLTMPEEMRRVLFKAHSDYLHAAFNQIAHDHGDTREFLRKVVGIDDAMQSKIEAALLSEK